MAQKTYELTIDCRNPRWITSFDLDGSRFQLYFNWNTRLSGWVLSIFDNDGKLLVGGMRLVCGAVLYGKYRATVPSLPKGDLILVDTEAGKENEYPGRNNLGTRFVLVYVGSENGI